MSHFGTNYNIAKLKVKRYYLKLEGIELDFGENKNENLVKLATKNRVHVK